MLCTAFTLNITVPLQVLYTSHVVNNVHTIILCVCMDIRTNIIILCACI